MLSISSTNTIIINTLIITIISKTIIVFNKCSIVITITSEAARRQRWRGIGRASGAEHCTKLCYTSPCYHYYDY